ncbi:MAG: hypothetical protein N2235_14905 [Fischerella sp.]|nr:hypothetical protein [Fischerella sp.]
MSMQSKFDVILKTSDRSQSFTITELKAIAQKNHIMNSQQSMAKSFHCILWTITS